MSQVTKVMPTQVFNLADVVAAPDDLRVADQELYHALERSVQAFGLLRLPVINTFNKHIVDGRLLVNVLRKLGVESCLMCCVNVPDGEDAQMLRVILNNHASDWRWEPVSMLLKQNRERALLSGFHSMDYAPLIAAAWDKGTPSETGGQFELELG